ncbi:threonylcarbamoyl-AMP synthase [Marinithermofilum abyssi]|uniref:Threonylcarbamoyl-AMP synthase n=1 Tax=Marinithermofilum abyssi TaxID=1571185 RepID=A0A8J2VG11_9BACL|nr:threonylcarbamoyl-AMP synthase [Marinithermofilum abyssi]
MDQLGQPYQTIRWHVDPEQSVDTLSRNKDIHEAARMLREGKLVAFPTETVYGLGADAASQEAVSAIYTAKGRPSDNPLIIHIGEKEQLYTLAAEVPPAGEVLMRRFWPGPLTLILPHRGTLAPKVTAGLDTVGVRMPSHPVSLALLRVSGAPVAAPSANRSGKPSPTDADHVWHDLQGRIHGLVDGGPTGVGVESTVVDVTGEVPLLLRPGGITWEELQEAVGEVQVDPAIVQEGTAPRSPGMKYRHYAPQGEMWVVVGEGAAQIRRVQALADEARRQGKKVGIFSTEEHRAYYQADWVLPCGSRQDPASIARELYRGLRRFDQLGADTIVAEGFPPEGLFHSVMNRLSKAAEGRVVQA